jgi:hypothetical protein
VLFESGIFTPDVINDARTENVLLAAVDSASIVRPSDLLYVCLTSGDPRILAALSTALPEGAQSGHVLEIIDIYHPRVVSPHFDGKRERFSAEALAALDEFSAALTNDWDRLRPVGLELLMISVLSHLDEDDRKHLSIVDVDAMITALRARLGVDPPAPLFDSASGRLRSEEFTEFAWAVLERAGTHAAELGYDRILPPHCLLALLGETEGLAERLVRLQTSLDMTPTKMAEVVADGFRLASRGHGPLRLHRDDIGEMFAALLRRAQHAAHARGSQQIDTSHLLVAILDDPPTRLVSILERDPVRLDLSKLRSQLDQWLLDGTAASTHDVVFRLPDDLLPAEDLTWRARAGDISPAQHLDGYFDVLSRALYRRTNNHVLITGPHGVGTTTLVTELARRAAAGEITFLARKRFVRMDCRVVAPAESGEKLAAIIAYLAGRKDVVLCLDGLGPLLRAESDGHNKLMLLSALREQRIHLVGVMDTTDYEDLLSADHALLEHITRVEMTEPGRDAALAMAGGIASSLSDEFGVTIEDRAVERAVVLSADYILYERLPAKAGKILRRACEDLDYERNQLGSERTSVTVADVITVVARLSGLPERQLSGVGTGGIDYNDGRRPGGGGGRRGKRTAVDQGRSPARVRDVLRRPDRGGQDRVGQGARPFLLRLQATSDLHHG